MDLLLDTCTFLWLAAKSPKLSNKAHSLFADPANRVFLSAASVWEIAVKYACGKLLLSEHPTRLVPSARKTYGIEALPIEESAAAQVSLLPKLHTDPFDRMLISQGIVHGLVILTPDEAIARYPVRTMW